MQQHNKKISKSLPAEQDFGKEKHDKEGMSPLQGKTLGIEKHNKKFTSQLQRKTFGITKHGKEKHTSTAGEKIWHKKELS
jgi:hypothetical protein